MPIKWWCWPTDFKRKRRKHLPQKWNVQFESKGNMSKKKSIKTLDEFVEEQYGKGGTKKRNELEAGYAAFKMGAIIQQTR